MDQNALLITAIVGVVLGGIGLIGGVLGYVQSTAAVRRSTHARQRAVTAEEEALRARAAAEATLRAAEELAERFRGSGARPQTGPVGTGRYVGVPPTRWDEQPGTGPVPTPMAEPTTGSTLLPDTGSNPMQVPVERRPAEQATPPVSATIPVQPGPTASPVDPRREPAPTTGSASIPSQNELPPVESRPVPEADASEPAAPPEEPQSDAERSESPRFVIQSVQVEGVQHSDERVPDETRPDSSNGQASEPEPETEPEPEESASEFEPEPAPEPEPEPQVDQQERDPGSAQVQADDEEAPDDSQAARDATGRVTAGVQGAPTMDWAEVLRTGAIPLPSISRGTYAAPRRRPKPTGQGPARFELRTIGRQRFEALNVGAEPALEARIVGGGDDPHLVRPLSSRPATVPPGGTLAFSVLRVEGRGVSVQVMHVLDGEPVHQDLPLD